MLKKRVTRAREGGRTVRSQSRRLRSREKAIQLSGARDKPLNSELSTRLGPAQERKSKYFAPHWLPHLGRIASASYTYPASKTRLPSQIQRSCSINVAIDMSFTCLATSLDLLPIQWPELKSPRLEHCRASQCPTNIHIGQHVSRPAAPAAQAL